MDSSPSKKRRTGPREANIGNDAVASERVLQAKAYLYDELHGRFAEVAIHVDGVNDVPKNVWYQRESAEGLLDHCHYKLIMEYSKLSGPLLPYLNNWSHPTGAKLAQMEFADLHIDHLGQILSMDTEKSPHGWTSLKGRLDLENHPTLTTLGLSYEQAAPSDFIGDVLLGFVNDMHNSAGAEALRAILEFTGKIAFGPHFPGKNSMTKIISFGTSKCHQVEGFPINVVEPLHLPKDVTDSRPLSQSSLSGVSDSLRRNNNYCDTVVASVDDNFWAKFLMVCEVKAGYQDFSDMEKTHFIRKMVAACMHQSEIFGLMLNARFARLFWLRHYPDKKELFCHELRKDECIFTSTDIDSDGKAFQSHELRRLLRDLVVVLTYGKEKISKVEPCLDPQSS